MMQREIIQKHEYMFRYNGWNDLHASLLSFGFECDSGWYQLIDDLCTELEAADPEHKLRVIQVKEKYGYLCFYTSGETNEIYDIIRRYEDQSQTICENCGQPGTLCTTGGWVKTLCNQCAKELHYVPYDNYSEVWP